MGLRSLKINNKKRAMSLGLVLVVITSLAVLTGASMKILSAATTKYQINENLNTTSQKVAKDKPSGKFLCYKKKSPNDGSTKLYQGRIDYNADGSINNFLNGEVNKCEFVIPEGVKRYEVQIIGGGGMGKYTDYNTSTATNFTSPCSLKPETEYESNNICSNVQIYKKTYTVTPTLECKAKSNSGTYGCDDTKKSYFKVKCLSHNEQRYTEDINNYFSSNYCIVKSGKVFKECRLDDACNSGEKYQGAFNTTFACSDFAVSFKYGSVNKTFSPGKTIGNCSQNAIKNVFDNEIQYQFKKVKYNVIDGKAGIPSQPNYFIINNTIYGVGGNSTIIIDKNSIADGGNKNNTTGGTTEFKYYVKIGDSYNPIVEKSSGGAQGGSQSKVILNDGYIAETKYSGAKSNFNLPIEFNIDSKTGAANLFTEGICQDATYFGSGGAPGCRQNVIPNSGCTQLKFTLGTASNTYNKDTTADCEKKGSFPSSEGAPGAILIMW